LVGFHGQICPHLCFLHCFPYIALAHMDAHSSINKVLPPIWLRRIKNQNSYQSLLHLLAKRASQPPSSLRSIIHIESIVPHSHFEYSVAQPHNNQLLGSETLSPPPSIWGIRQQLKKEIRFQVKYIQPTGLSDRSTFWFTNAVCALALRCVTG